MSLKQEAILAKILKDRERRAVTRKQFSSQGFSSVSLNFNIPGYPKTNSLIKNCFSKVVANLTDYLIAHRINTNQTKKVEWSTDCGDFFLVPISCNDYNHEEVKEILEQFEITHELGRLLDVDLYTSDDNFISSRKEKKCFLCQNIARICMLERKHEYTDYKAYITEKIQIFLDKKRKEDTISYIGAKALQATLMEVSLEHKPGLICPSSNGAHTDMDYLTFLSSSSALSYHWNKITNFGYDCGRMSNLDFQGWKIQLRILGLEAEKDMFASTHKVNTQKGIVFLLGLGCFASGLVFARKNKFDTELFRQTVQEVTKGIVADDLGLGKAQYGTHGEQCFKNYGRKAGGARLEAQEGFPTVFSFALEFLENQIGKGNYKLTKPEWQQTLLDLLLLIISKSNDTNILYRKNQESLQIVQCKAARVLKLNKEKQKQEALDEFGKYCAEQNISPGGTADLLALTLFIYLIKEYEWK